MREWLFSTIIAMVIIVTIAVFAIYGLGCEVRYEPSSTEAATSTDMVTPEVDVTLADLPAEKSPEADKLNAWRRQLEQKQAELAARSDELTGRERALNVSEKGWRKASIIGIEIKHYSTDIESECSITMMFEDDREIKTVEIPYRTVREFCGSDDLNALINMTVWYATNKISSLKPGGMMMIDMREKVGK